jgi:hypothetical protein
VPQRLERLDSIAGSQINNEGEYSGPLNVAEESNSKTSIEVRALDKARNVGYGEPCA